MSLQLRQARDRLRAAIKDGEGLIEQAPERFELAGIIADRKARDHERDIYFRLGIRQPVQVVDRALGWKDFEVDAVARQDLSIALGVGFESATRRTCADGDGPRRGGAEEMQRSPDQDHA